MSNFPPLKHHAEDRDEQLRAEAITCPKLNSAMLNNLNMFSHKRGNLSRIVRDAYNIKVERLVRFIRFEAHLNIDHTNTNIDNQLISIGFEPDDFIELNPKCYNYNFTFAFDVAAGERMFDFRDIFKQRINNAEKIIQNSDAIGFIEAEIFPDLCIRLFDSFENNRAAPFPLQSNELVSIDIPDQLYSTPTAWTPFTRKNCDIHVKIIGHVDEVKPNKVGLCSSSSEFAWMMAQIGFYRIRSNSGNTIYTGQFIDGELARNIFDRLCTYNEMTRFASSIIIEPCIYMWRKMTKLQMELYLHLFLQF